MCILLLNATSLVVYSLPLMIPGFRGGKKGRNGRYFPAVNLLPVRKD